MAFEDRRYQRDAVEAVFGEYDKGIDSTLLVMPTGTGKTTVAAMVAGRAKERGQRSLFLAHREILVNQAAATLREAGLRVAVEMASEDARRSAARIGHPDVVVGTVQTMSGQRLSGWERDYFGQIITDEAHRGAAPLHGGVYDHFQGCKHLGITATPDGAKSISKVFQTTCFEYKLTQAINDGYLSPIERRRCKIEIDLRDMKYVGGDFNMGRLSERISPKVESICRGIVKEVADRPTVVFTPDVFSAKNCAETLTALGMPSKYVAGSAGNWGMPREERRAILREFGDRQFQTVVCCDLLVEGWDCPFVEAVVVARPTLQRYRFVQMVGRGTRICPETGKRLCVVVDFDWKTDESARNLIMDCTDLFVDEDRDPEVHAMTRRQVVDFGEVDVKKATEESERAWRVCGSHFITLTGAKAEYSTEVLDPVGVAKAIGVKLTKYDKDPWKSGPATPAQLNLLRQLGVTQPGKLSRWGGTKMIKALLKRKDEKRAQVAQVGKMLRLGMDEQNARLLTESQASHALREVEAVRPVAEGILFPKGVL